MDKAIKVTIIEVILAMVAVFILQLTTEIAPSPFLGLGLWTLFKVNCITHKR